MEKTQVLLIKKKSLVNLDKCIYLNQGFPKWAMTDIQRAMRHKGAKGGSMSCKGATGGHEVIIKTYTRYYGVVD